jgi:hypothetical protein
MFVELLLSGLAIDVNVIVVTNNLTGWLWRRKVSTNWPDFWRTNRLFQGGAMMVYISVVLSYRFVVVMSIKAIVTGLAL